MDKIKKLQRLLKEQGYNIQIDGKWGPKSQEAYKNFQTKQGMSEATSVLNPVTTAYNLLPLNVRSLAEDIVVPDMFKQPITEHDLNNRQKKSLQEVVRKNLKEGKTTISYKDYGTSDNPYSDVDPTGSSTGDLIKKSITSPNYNLKSTIGQASIVIPPGSNDTLVVDQYNFNDSVSEDMKLIDRIKGYKNESEGGYGTFRKAGKYFGSKEGKGSPVIINTSQKRKGGMDYYRSGGRRYYQTAGVDESMYDNSIPQGYNPASSTSGSYSTQSSTVSNDMYVPGSDQDLATQQAMLNEQGPDSSQEEAEISGKFSGINQGVDMGLKLLGAEANPIDMAADQIFSDQDASTYKAGEIAADVGQLFYDPIGGAKDLVMKTLERNKLKAAQERERKEHEQKVNTLATQQDIEESNQRMQSGINFGQDLSSNQQKYARYGGPAKYYTGGYIGSTFENVDVNKDQYDKITDENDYNLSLYGGQRFTNKWGEGPMTYDDYNSDSKEFENTTMQNKLETIQPKEVRMGLNRQDQRGSQFAKPNRPISDRYNKFLSKQSDEHYDAVMENRNDKLYRKELDMRNKFQTGLKGAQEAGKEKKYLRNYNRDARRFEKFGNTESGFKNFFRKIFGTQDRARTAPKFQFGKGYATGGVEEGEEKMALNIPGINMANMKKEYPDIVNKLDTLSDKDKMGLMKYIGETRQSATDIYNDEGKLDIGKTTSWFSNLDTDPLVNYRDTAGISKDEFRELVQSEVNPQGKWVNSKLINAAMGAKGLRSGGRPLPGGKVYDLPSGAKKYVGATHEEGGIDKNAMTEVENGETEENILGKPYIFSSYLKKGGTSYAKMHEDILRKGGSDNEKINLAVDQEKKAGRDPKKLFMKHGGMHKNKYNTGGTLSGMTAPQRRQFFIDAYGYDVGSDYDFGDITMTDDAYSDINDNEIVLDNSKNANKDIFTTDESITENVKNVENNVNNTNRLTWKDQVAKLKNGKSMDALTAIAAMAPVAQQLRNAKNIDRMPLPGLTPQVTPNKIQYGNMNKERAQNERDYQKMVNFVQTQGGSMSDQMAAYSKKLDANANVGSQEQDANREVDALNSRAIFEAAKFNATGKSQDIKNKMYVDEFNLASKAASEDATVEAMQVGAENLGVLNRDRKLQDASDRLSAAIDGGSGVLLREKYGKEDYEKLVKAARNGDADALRELEEASILLNEEVKQKKTDEKGKAGK